MDMNELVRNALNSVVNYLRTRTLQLIVGCRSPCVVLLAVSASLASADDVEDVVKGLQRLEQRLWDHRKVESDHYRGASELRPNVVATSVTKSCDNMRLLEVREKLPERFRSEDREHITRVYVAGARQGFTLRGEPGNWLISNHSTEIDPELVDDFLLGSCGIGVSACYELASGQKVADLLSRPSCTSRCKPLKGSKSLVKITMTFESPVVFSLRGSEGNSLRFAEVVCDTSNNYAIVSSIANLSSPPMKMFPDGIESESKVEVEYEDAFPKVIFWQATDMKSDSVLASSKTVVQSVVQGVKPKEFTLAAYGLPELTPSSTSGNSHWVLINFILFAVVGGWFFMKTFNRSGTLKLGRKF